MCLHVCIFFYVYPAALFCNCVLSNQQHTWVNDSVYGCLSKVIVSSSLIPTDLIVEAQGTEQDEHKSSEFLNIVFNVVSLVSISVRKKNMKASLGNCERSRVQSCMIGDSMWIFSDVYTDLIISTFDI